MNRLQKWSALAVGLVLTLIVILGAAQEPARRRERKLEGIASPRGRE